MTSIGQQASISAQRVYFRGHSNEISLKIADGDLPRVHALGPFDNKQANDAMTEAALCNQGEIFDYFFENYSIDSGARNNSVINFSRFADLKRIEQILDKGTINQAARFHALENAARHGHRGLISKLMDLGEVPKEKLKTYAKLSKDNGYESLAGFFNNAVQGLS